MEYSLRRMGASTKANGRMARCMVQVLKHGQVGNHISVTTLRIVDMGKEYSRGQTEESTMECGRMVSSTARVSSPNPMALLGKVTGTMEREQNG